MKVSLRAVRLSEKLELQALIQEYQREILNIEPGVYRYLSSYWDDQSRHAYYILCDKEIAGFVLVNKYTIILENANSIAEFYVKKMYRKLGIGTEAAIQTFKKFPGSWEIRQLADNSVGHEFWKRTISKYTHDIYEEHEVDNDKWVGYIQTFSK